MMIVQKVVGWY